MPKFIIEWDAGYGQQNEVVEAADMAEAEKMAETACRQDLESMLDYGAEEYSKERAVYLELETKENEDDPA